MLNFVHYFVCSDEDTDVKAIVQTWLNKLPESDRDRLSGWIEDFFYQGLEFVLKQVVYPMFCQTILVINNLIIMNFIVNQSKGGHNGTLHKTMFYNTTNLT